MLQHKGALLAFTDLKAAENCLTKSVSAEKWPLLLFELNSNHLCRSNSSPVRGVAGWPWARCSGPRATLTQQRTASSTWVATCHAAYYWHITILGYWTPLRRTCDTRDSCTATAIHGAATARRHWWVKYILLYLECLAMWLILDRGCQAEKCNRSGGSGQRSCRARCARWCFVVYVVDSCGAEQWLTPVKQMSSGMRIWRTSFTTQDCASTSLNWHAKHSLPTNKLWVYVWHVSFCDLHRR